MHIAVKEGPNCLNSQLQIPTGLNVGLGKKLLTHYWHHQLLFYIKYEFPMDIVMGSDIFQPQPSITNHTSAENYVKYVNTHIPAGTKA